MTRTGKWARRAVWGTLVAVMTVGCNPITTLGFLLHKDTKIPAEYPLRPKEGEKADKEKELTVAVLTGQTGGVGYEFAGADRELATMMAKRFPEMGKENKDKIAVVPPAQVDKFKAQNPNWKSMHPAAIGKKLGADVVLDVTVSNLTVYQPGSGNMIYEGRAEVSVDVYETTAEGGEPKHRYVHPYIYPKTGMIAASDVPVSRFKMLFLERLAVELCRKHVEHRPADGIASER